MSADVTNGTSSAAPILSVRDLKTYFFPDEGIVKAVDGASFDDALRSESTRLNSSH